MELRQLRYFVKVVEAGSMSRAALDLDLERTVDILAAVAARPDRPFVVGFAAETNDVEMHARQKLAKKNLDLIAGLLRQAGQQARAMREVTQGSAQNS